MFADDPAIMSMLNRKEISHGPATLLSWQQRELDGPNIETVDFYKYLGINVAIDISQGQTQNVVNRVVNVCSRITGTAHETLQNLYSKQLRKTEQSILSDCSHPFNSFCHLVPPQTSTARSQYIQTLLYTLNWVFFTVYLLYYCLMCAECMHPNQSEPLIF